MKEPTNSSIRAVHSFSGRANGKKCTNLFYDNLIAKHKNIYLTEEQTFIEWLGFQYKIE